MPPARIRANQLLELLAALGAAAPEQLVAASIGIVPAQLSTADILRGDAAVHRLVRAGHVALRDVPCPRGILRIGRRTLWRLTGMGEHAAPTTGGARAVTLASIERLGRASATGWVDERALQADRYPATRRPAAVRYRLRQLVQQHLVECRHTRSAGHVRVATVTERGRRHLAVVARRLGRSSPAVIAAPRDGHAVHHLLTVAAALQHTAMRGGRIIRLLGDTELRQDARSGRRTRAGDRITPIPDGTVVYRAAECDGASRVATHRVEVLVSGYTTADIMAKYAAPFAGDTEFYALTGRLCDRVTRLGAPRPTLLMATSATAPDVLGRAAGGPPSRDRSYPPTRQHRALGQPARRRRRNVTTAAVIECLQRHGVATTAQLATHLAHGGRPGTSYAAAIVRRLTRRGLVRAVRVFPTLGRASPIAIARTDASAILESPRLPEHLQETEVRLRRAREGWRALTDAEQPSAWQEYARRHRSRPGLTDAERTRWRDLLTRDALLHLPTMVIAHAPSHDVRVLLRVSELGRVLSRLAASPWLAGLGTLPVELVAERENQVALATQRLSTWATQHGVEVQVWTLPPWVPTVASGTPSRSSRRP